MALFERGYQAAARAELDREVRELEDKDKVAQMLNPEQAVASVTSNADFAERIGLISEASAMQLRERVKKAQLDYERFQRETRDIVNDYENPRERAARYQSMDKVLAQINAERAKEQTEKAAEQTKAISKSEAERSR